MVASQRESYWKAHVERFETSGLSQRAYCDRHNVSMTSLHRWRRLLAHKPQSRAVEIVPTGNLLARPPMAVPTPCVTLTVIAGRYRVEVTDGFSPDTLSALLDVLEERGA